LTINGKFIDFASNRAIMTYFSFFYVKILADSLFFCRHFHAVFDENASLNGYRQLLFSPPWRTCCPSLFIRKDMLSDRKPQRI